MGPIHDVCVIGGGPAALAAALALLDAGRDVFVVRTSVPAAAFGEHLSPSAWPVLRRLGAADVLDRPYHRRCPGITSHWGTSTPIRRSALGTPGGLGYVIDRARFVADLTALFPPKRLVTVDKLGDLHWQGGSWSLDPVNLRARFLVDATGRRAAIARRLGASIVRYGRQVAVHAMVDPRANLPQGADLGVASGPDGWGYSVSLADGRAAAAAICDPTSIPKNSSARSDWTLRYLTGLGLLPPDARLLSARVVPCGMQRSHPSAGPNWFAIGDASFATDPLTGDGIRHALSSGAAAPEILKDGMADYSAEEERAFTRFLKRLRDQYQRERRFMDAPIWRGWTAPVDPTVASAQPVDVRALMNHHGFAGGLPV